MAENISMKQDMLCARKSGEKCCLFLRFEIKVNDLGFPSRQNMSRGRYHHLSMNTFLLTFFFGYIIYLSLALCPELLSFTITSVFNLRYLASFDY